MPCNLIISKWAGWNIGNETRHAQSAEKIGDMHFVQNFFIHSTKISEIFRGNSGKVPEKFLKNSGKVWDCQNFSGNSQISKTVPR